MTDQPYERPDTDDLLQEDGEPMPLTPIPVVVDGPVRVQRPGNRAMTSTAFTIGDDMAVPIAGEDLRRSRVVLYARSGTASFYVGPDRRIVQAGRAAVFNSGVTVELTSTEPLYAMSATAATDCTLSVILESWTD